jgi:cytochrome b
MSGMRLSMKVWDGPVRLFHWAMVILIVTSWYTGEYGATTKWHFLSGYAVATLLLFRLAWGFVGSDTARFRRFLKSPIAAFRHLAEFPRRKPDNEIGHNAAGGWMVLVMLVLLLVQVGTGLFSNADFERAPLAGFVSDEMSNRISAIHALNFKIIEAAVLLHVLAVFAYAVIRRQNLLRPMITGKKRMPVNMRAPRMASPWLALALLVLAGIVVWVVVSLGN